MHTRKGKPTLRCPTRRDCLTRHCLTVSCTAETKSYHPPTVISRSRCIEQSHQSKRVSTTSHQLDSRPAPCLKLRRNDLLLGPSRPSTRTPEGFVSHQREGHIRLNPEKDHTVDRNVPFTACDNEKSYISSRPCITRKEISLCCRRPLPREM